MIFIIRLFPEISIKSPPVRKRWTKHLTDNLRTLCRRIHADVKVRNDWDKIEVKLPDSAASLEAAFVDLLGRTPGISNYSLARAYPFESMHDVYERCLAVWQEALAGKTFCVRVRRSGKHDFSSIDMERYIGGGLNQNTQSAGVRLKDPDVTVFVEVRDDYCYIVSKKYQGIGGFPVGTQESVISLISGGFDSSVASYLMIKRGVRTHFCFFNLGGRAHETAVKEVAFFLWHRFGSTHKVRFITVPFEEVVAEILEKIDPSNMGVVLKRMMMRAADKIAERGGVQAIVTGEAIAQVSSQTLPNLKMIDCVSHNLVLRPLIAMDKPDIIKLSQQIGAEEFSSSIPEYCGVISVKPSAKVNPERLLAQEQKFDFNKLDDAVVAATVQVIDEVMADVRAASKDTVQVTENAADGVIIDIRHPHETESRPMVLENISVLEIPFYRLNTEFKKLDVSKTYLLYCDKGVMSELHAGHLMDAGFKNVAVYRPI